MYDVIINGEDIRDVIIKSPYTTLFVCPSSIDLAGSEIELVSMENREYILLELERLIDNLTVYKNAIEKEDKKGLSEALKAGSLLREQIK